MTPYKILLVDDHALVRKGIISILSKNQMTSEIMEAATGTEALEIIFREEPEIVLIDISLPDMTGIDVIKNVYEKLNKTKVKFLVISMYDAFEYYYRAVKAGALGMINKDLNEVELFTGIFTVMSGEYYFGQKNSVTDIRNIIAEFDKIDFQNHDPENIPLSTRESEVLALVYRGFQNYAIAEKLQISERTIETYRKNIMLKFNLKSFTELTVLINSSEKLKKLVGNCVLELKH